MAALTKTPSTSLVLSTEQLLTLVPATSPTHSLLVRPTPQLLVELVTTPLLSTLQTCRQLPRLTVVPAWTPFPSVRVLSGGSIVGGADNDTLNFSAGVNNGAFVSGDTGSDLLLFSSTISGSQIEGGTGGDSMVFKGAISNSTIDFGADSDTLTFSVAATSATILGGAGADTLIFSSGANLVKTSISGGADGDSLYFSAGTQTSASIAGGGGNDTMVFNDTIGGACGSAWIQVLIPSAS